MIFQSEDGRIAAIMPLYASHEMEIEASVAGEFLGMGRPEYSPTHVGEGAPDKEGLEGVKEATESMWQRLRAISQDINTLKAWGWKELKGNKKAEKRIDAIEDMADKAEGFWYNADSMLRDFARARPRIDPRPPCQSFGGGAKGGGRRGEIGGGNAFRVGRVENAHLYQRYWRCCAPRGVGGGFSQGSAGEVGGVCCQPAAHSDRRGRRRRGIRCGHCGIGMG